MKKTKKPIVAAILGGLFGPLGYFYLGWRAAVCAFICWVAVIAAKMGFKIGASGTLGDLVLMAVFGFSAYMIAQAINEREQVGAGVVLGSMLFPFLCTALCAAECLYKAGRTLSDGHLGSAAAQLGLSLILIPLTFFISQFVASFTTLPLCAFVMSTSGIRETAPMSDDKEQLKETPEQE